MANLDLSAVLPLLAQGESAAIALAPLLLEKFGVPQTEAANVATLLKTFDALARTPEAAAFAAALKAVVEG